MRHPGTFNANPLTAAAGVAALNGLRDGAPVRAANAAGERLCRGWNEAIRRAEVPGAAYCQGSMVHVVLGRDLPPPEDGVNWNFAAAGRPATTPRTPAAIEWPFRRSLLLHGVDLIGMGALTSAVHRRGRHRRRDRRLRGRPVRPAPGVDPLASDRLAAAARPRSARCVACSLDKPRPRMRK